MTLRHLTVAAVALAALTTAACESFPGTPAPSSCNAGDKICYHEPESGRDYVLRCNAGEVGGAIWLIDDVCVDGEVCQVDQCVDASAAP